MCRNYHQVKIAHYGSARTYSVEGGIQFKASKELLIGAHISNPTGNEYDHDLNAVVPVKAEFGGAYRFSERVQVNAAFIKILNSTARMHLGLEYNIDEWFYLRGGFSSNPVMEYGGFGLDYQRFGFSAATSYHDRTVSPNTSYCYVVTASSGGVQSSPSNEACATGK